MLADQHVIQKELLEERGGGGCCTERCADVEVCYAQAAETRMFVSK